MGWTGIHSDYRDNNGKIDRKKTLREELFSHWEGYACVEDGMVGKTYYAAVKEPSGGVFAIVCLTQVNENGYFNFVYKVIDETMGPGEYSCPKKVLNALTTTYSNTAKEWRARCWEYRNKQTSPKAFKNIELGTEIEWIVPHDFTEYFKKGDRVRLIKVKRNPYIHRSRHVWMGRVFGRNIVIRPNLVNEQDFDFVHPICRSTYL